MLSTNFYGLLTNMDLKIKVGKVLLVATASLVNYYTAGGPKLVEQPYLAHPSAPR